MADVSFYFTKQGTGPDLIILHGLLGSSKNWQLQAKNLSNHFTVYCLDMPNHGLSYRAIDMDYVTTAKNLNTWIVENSLEQANLLGHSMGGKIAMKAVDLNSNLYNKVIIVDIAPVDYPLHHLEIFKALNLIELNNIKNRNEADDVLKQYINTPSVRNFLLHSLQFKNNRWAWAFHLENLTKNQASVAKNPNLKTLSYNPTLFIKGQESDYIKAAYQKNITCHFNDVYFKQIANSGHWPHSEKAKVFTHMVLNFLKQ